MNEIRSKYQKKNYEEITIIYDEFTCWKCNRDFMVDLDQCDTEMDLYQCKPFQIFKCPYCSAKHRVHI